MYYINVFAFTCFLILVSNYALADSAKIRTLDAVAKEPLTSLGENTDARTILFEFDRNEDFKATLNNKGEWKIEAWVQHTGLLCADYRLGLRFGQGNPGCINVKWLNEPKYATLQKQCNNTRMHHSGWEYSPEIIKHLDNITCAQALTKCTGRCP